MENAFQKNLKTLAEEFSQKEIAKRTGFSQSSINNYLNKSSEPSIQFLVSLKNGFGIDIDDFLFSETKHQVQNDCDKFLGNYIVYYYNNNSYKGEVHNNLRSTLCSGVISIFKENGNVLALASFMKERAGATKLLKECKGAKTGKDFEKILSQGGSLYRGTIGATAQSVFFELKSEENGDQTYIILNNPPTKSEYIGGVGTVNSVARGREHNPCVQFILLSKKLLDVPDGELYQCLNLDDYNVNMDDDMKEIIALFKRLYVEKNEISLALSETQKQAIVRNKIEYHLSEILEANVFRFAKVSNKEDDAIFKLIKEGIDV